jgi:hypothetical protein
MLKHVVWRRGREGGRVAVLYDEDWKYLTIKPIGGNHPPIGLLFAFLDATIYEWRRKMIDDFRSNCWNKYDWGVEVKKSQFGGVTYLTKRLLDERLFHVKVTARLHVTCFGKFHVIEGKIGELAPIFETIRASQVVLQMQDDYRTWEGTDYDGEFVWLTVVALSKEFDDFYASWRIPELETPQEHEPAPMVEVV